MSIKQQFDPALENRLYEWGSWCLDVKNNLVGYPTQSPLVAVIEVGIFCPNFGPREPKLNERAMEISKWVKVLSFSFPKYAEALQDYYFNPRATTKVLAKIRKISDSNFKARLHGGKVWMSGRLNAEAEKQQNMKEGERYGYATP